MTQTGFPWPDVGTGKSWVSGDWKEAVLLWLNMEISCGQGSPPSVHSFFQREIEDRHIWWWCHVREKGPSLKSWVIDPTIVCLEFGVDILSLWLCKNLNCGSSSGDCTELFTLFPYIMTMSVTICTFLRLWKALISYVDHSWFELRPTAVGP